MPSQKPKPKSRSYAQNRKARYDYEILDTFEAGIELTGGEVKSIKYGQASIKEAFVAVDQGEIWLWNAHVPKWTFSSETGHEPTRKRKLLMHRAEIDKLGVASRQKGVTLIPLKLYGVRGKVKVLIGLCRGKKQYEKRAREKERRLKEELAKERRKYMV